MKKILLIFILMFSLGTFAQQRVSVYIHMTGNVYNVNDLTSKDGVIYKCLTQTSDTPPSANWEATGGTGTSSPLTTKGDIYTFDTDNARLNIGVNGQVLTANSTTATGLEWSSAGGGGDVLKVGTPIDNQIGIWTGDGTIEGDSDLVFDGLNLTVSGDIFADNLEIVNWDLAYGWGDHSTEGYITNVQETDQVYVASQASNIDAGDITNLANLSGENTGDQNLNDHFAITSNYATLLSDKNRKGLITSSITVTLTSIGTGEAEFEMYFLNRSGSTVSFNLASSPQQYTDQYGTGNIPNLPNGYYAYIELVADNVWSIIIGAESGGSGAVDSVNSYTGTVILDADDIDDSSTTNKFTTAGDISKLAGIEAGATVDQDLSDLQTKDMNTLSKASYTTTLADKGAFISITSGDITLDKTNGGGLPDGFNQTFYNESGGIIKFIGDAASGVNNDIPNGYFGVAILDGTTWKVSTPSSGGGSGAVESVNTQTGVVVLDTDDILDTATNRYLSDAEIAILDAWVAEGSNMPRLDAANHFIGVNSFDGIINHKGVLNWYDSADNVSGLITPNINQFSISTLGQLDLNGANIDIHSTNELIASNTTIAKIDSGLDKSLVTKEWTLDKINAAGGGNVSNTGTPLNDQLAIWTDATTIEGTNDLRFSGTSLITPNLTASNNISAVGEFRFLSSSQIPQGEMFYDSGIVGVLVQADNILQFGSPTIQTDPNIVDDINLYTTSTLGIKIDPVGRVFGTGNSDLAIMSTSDDTILITKSYGDANYNGIVNIVEDLTPQLGGNLDLNGNTIGDDVTSNVIGITTSTTYPSSVHLATASNNMSGHILNTDGSLYESGVQIVNVASGEALYAEVETIEDKTLTIASIESNSFENNTYYKCNNASTQTITINQGVAKRSAKLFQYGGGQVVLSAGSGVTIRCTMTTPKTKEQYSTISVLWLSSTEVLISGDLEVN